METQLKKIFNTPNIHSSFQSLQNYVNHVLNKESATQSPKYVL